LLLWLSLSAAAAACLVGVGCSSSDDSGTPAAAGKGGSGHSGGATATAGSDSDSQAGEAATGGVPDEPDTGEGGRTQPSGGGASGGKAGAAGGSTHTGGSSTGGSGTGQAGEPGEGGAGGSPDSGDPELAAAQARAIALIDGLSAVRKCTTCHQTDFGGSGFFANVTPDATTGIGSWDENDIKVAIRDGKDKDGNELCLTMERYPFSDAELSDLAIYLKHLAPVKRKINAKCP
jgi:hypothetical protein